ncbi:phBC6A51 family helix-turn-helix protein [Halobacillus karajensis]|uniref:phBC6A51 family helix-turn-helix protein n=1 Tax=Halobacillus karajensis TaxID=195088 RepID=UPI00045D1D4E|nr:phBC6A51 family helix-turn-helix protein [Halobacillus karajensis]CDQ21685.1 hypothetical protein BN982_04094 [Halobacillus karajensis]
MKRTLNETQKKYVELMLDDNFYTNEQLAELVGVDVRSIYRYKQNPTITEEINKKADSTLGQLVPEANRKMADLMRDGSENAQLKVLDMLYKATGKYKDQSEITVNEGTKSPEERKASLLSKLKG